MLHRPFGGCVRFFHLHCLSTEKSIESIDSYNFFLLNWVLEQPSSFNLLFLGQTRMQIFLLI